MARVALDSNGVLPHKSGMHRAVGVASRAVFAEKRTAALLRTKYDILDPLRFGEDPDDVGRGAGRVLTLWASALWVNKS